MIYAVKNKNYQDRLNSSSGGIFVLLARNTINKGGIVFGVAYNGTNVEHIEVSKLEDIIRLQKSKYVRSNLKDSYSKVKEYLDKGIEVLFSGTPCQVKGLKLYLKQDYDNLLCIDNICHGTPTRKAYQEYIKENNITSIDFRDKSKGWNGYHININGKLEYFADNKYMQDFINNRNLEASCYNCQSKELKSGSDIKLSDFWGIQYIRPNFSDDKGISAVFINTKKGEQVFNEIKDLIYKEEVSIEEATKYNSSYYNSAIRR